MLPAPSACGPTRLHLPMPPRFRQSAEPNFMRPRQFIHDYAPPLVSQTNTFRSHLSYRNDIDPTQSRNVDNEQANVCNQQQQRQCLPDSNQLPNNQEGNSQQAPQQERKSTNGDRMPSGCSANNCQPSGPTLNTRISSSRLAPAMDDYSFLNRLCELFPDIHPTQLQRVFDECGRDFLRTIDNVLYARRFRKSLVAQMSKFRSLQRSQTQNNFISNPQQQKEQLPQSQTQKTQPERPPQKAPKSQQSAKTPNSHQPKRSRILAFNSSSSCGPSAPRRGGVHSPKRTQSQPIPATSTSAVSQPFQLVRKSPPPPNVFFHQIENGQQIRGGGDANMNRNSNTGYVLSYKKPHTLHYGAPSSVSSSSTAPTVSDATVFRTPLLPPSIRYTHSNDCSLGGWCPRVQGCLDQQLPTSSQEAQEQQQQQQEQQLQQQLQQQQPSGNEENLSLAQESNLPFPADNFEVVQQENEQGPGEWTLLFKNMVDPLNPVESNANGSDVMNAAQITQSGTYDVINQDQLQTSGNGGCFYRLPVVIEPNLNQDCQKSGAKDSRSGEGMESLNQQGEESRCEDAAEEIASDENGRSEERDCNKNVEFANLSSPVIAKRTRRSCHMQHGTDAMDEGMKSMEKSSNNLTKDNIQVETNEPVFSPANQLVIDTDPWVHSTENSEERVEDTESAVQSDEDGEFGQILGI